MKIATCFLLLVSFFFCSFSYGKVDSYDSIKAAIQFWETDSNKDFTKTPVYFGEVRWRESDGTEDFRFCMALAFMSYDDNKKQIHYAHKIWNQKNNKCDYGNYKEPVVANYHRSACLNDSRVDQDGVTNRQLDNTNIAYFSTTDSSKQAVYRTLNFADKEVTQYLTCDHKPLPQGVAPPEQLEIATIEDGSFVMKRQVVPFIYDVNIKPINTFNGIEKPPAPSQESDYNSLED